MGEQVAVRRSGGFVGRTVEGVVDLGSDDARVPEVRALLERIDPAVVPEPEPRPDMYVYDFDLAGAGCTVAEAQLTDDLRRLAELLID